MAILAFLKTDIKAPKQDKIAPVRIYRLTSSKGFKGYKKTILTTHSKENSEWQENTDKLIAQNGNELSNLPVVLEIRNTAPSNQNYVAVIVSELEIGVIFDRAPFFKEIVNGNISSIHFRNETENIVDSNGLHQRNKITAFVKLS